ncbi:hypothetical protein [Luteipulveratus halotolerans]|uniref:Uncharacterized protein n=1 Tax=Luteipulveratus halotolerans TaxID=1631356 RepID=A0A0L6CJG7_9MICO|nr:hypothetical protein [Luteipulveratus halotolerans]KNX37755.1 hypothetical protein VV01_12310 [Luteipulveratus halotolerans]
MHSDPHLIGGEMASWADLPDTAPLGALEAAALAAVPPSAARILLAGPRASLLHNAFPGRAVDVLVRGVPDAEALAEAGCAVLCGALDRVPAGSAYDVVVLLDPPETVLSPDSPGLSHGDTLGTAADALDDAGTLIALVPNEIGVDVLATERRPHRLDDDSAWWVGTGGYDVRRPFHRELRGLLSDAGLSLRAGRSVLPGAADPVVVVDSRSEDDVTATVEALAASVHVVPGADRAVDAVEAGATRDLAGAWLLVCGRTPGEITLPTLFAAAESGALASRRLPLLRALRDGDLHRLRGLLADLRSAGADDTAYEAALDDLAEQVAHRAGAHPFGPELDAEQVVAELRLLGGGSLPVARVRRPAPVAEAGTSRERELESALRDRSAQVASLHHKASQQERRIRALEHAVATSDSPWPRRTLLVMTAPTRRIVEAARSRARRG